MIKVGINCCSKLANTNVCKDFKCFNEQANRGLLERLLATDILFFQDSNCRNFIPCFNHKLINPTFKVTNINFVCFSAQID